ncbi:MAG: hypothetical protein L0271_12735, partial [Gemmatimonadetes bacterium]|nr:hypothetical protein [Gemmatimonadota bacterium]
TDPRDLAARRGAGRTVIRFVTWLWRQPGYRKRFTPETVNTLRRMIARHVHVDHDFTCVTDVRAGFDPDVQVMALPVIPAVQLPGGRPNCYRRLWLFSDAAATAFPGDRIVNLDLDCIIVGPLGRLLAREEDFVIWRDPFFPRQYNGSLWMLRPGALPQVWTRFRGQASLAEQRGFHGSDQGWISRVMGPDAATWNAADGVLSYKADVLRHHAGTLPSHARVVIFHGKPDPWESFNVGWIREHYR